MQILSLENPFLALAAAFVGLAGGLLLLLAWQLAQLLLVPVYHWRLLATCAGIVGAALVCVLWPAVPLAIAMIALFGWATYPRPAVH